MEIYGTPSDLAQVFWFVQSFSEGNYRHF